MARSTDDQLYAVTKLVGYCEGVVASGVMSELGEYQLRRLIAQTLIAFNMEPHQGDVRQAMEQVR